MPTAGGKCIKQQINPSQAVVGVLRREIYAMVVIPECAECLIDVSGAGVGGKNARQNVGIVLIIELARLEEVAGKAVTFRRGVAVVQASGCRRRSKAVVVIQRQGI